MAHLYLLIGGLGSPPSFPSSFGLLIHENQLAIHGYMHFYISTNHKHSLSMLEDRIMKKELHSKSLICTMYVSNHNTNEIQFIIKCNQQRL
jgi:hypothetical protein